MIALNKQHTTAGVGRRKGVDVGLFVGAFVLGAMILASIAAPWLASYDPDAQNLSLRLLPPACVFGGSELHLLGTDGFGRDMLSRLIFGSRVSLLVGATAVVVAGLIGVATGLVAGFNGGWAESIIISLADAQQGLPPILFSIIIVAVLGTSVVNLIAVLGLSSWVIYTRVVFARTIVLRRREFVEAAYAAGATTRRILLRHLLPNILGHIAVVSTLQAGRMILLEASLSFLGLGVPPPTASWGSMLAEARPFLFVSPWQAGLPGLAIVFTVWSVNMLGEGFRRRYDPRRS